MFRCRLIRTVVNLSLIVAMIMQPGIALTLANDCETRCASTFMCEGCGCCEVASLEEKCCCCGGGKRTENAESCCMDGAESEDSSECSVELMQPGVALELQVIVISTTEPPIAAVSDTTIRSATPNVEVTSRCGCGVKHPPLGESTPARPSISSRDSVAIKHSDLADLFGGLILLRRSSSVRGEDFLQPHFSQIQLCIWRL